MKLREVIKHEGDKWVLYASDGKKKLGGPFDTEEEAKKRERQIQFFKHQGESRRSAALLVEKMRHTAAWHRCWDNVKKSYDDRAAAAICTLSIQRAPNPPDVYKGAAAEAATVNGSQSAAQSAAQLREAIVTITLDDAYALDEVLAAEMELRGLASIAINTEDWSIAEIGGDGQAQNPVSPAPSAEYTEAQEAVRKSLAGHGLLEVGARHTQREYQIIEQVIKLMAELHGEIASLDELLANVQEAGNANVASYLESRIHQSFTVDADNMFAEGVIGREERIALSHAIGMALDTFSAQVDAALPGLRSKPLDLRYTQFSEPDRSLAASARPLTESLSRSLTEVSLDEHGNLQGRVVVEGESQNRNIYTISALESVPMAFAGIQIFADHPARDDEINRPERSVHDLVGKLPDTPSNFWIDTVKEGPFADRKAAFFKGGILSESADWLRTLIREKIAGEMSLRAIGEGYEDESKRFVVEAFQRNEVSTSLDFVTRAAAGGRGELQESTPAGQPNKPCAVDISLLTVAQLAEARPDILDGIAQRERQKAYGEKKELQNLREANAMANQQLTEAQKLVNQLKDKLAQAMRGERKLQSEKIVDGALSESGLPDQARARVKRLVESAMQQFIEAPKVPEVKLPADVEALPDEAKAIWLKTYMDTMTPGNEDTAMHKAWAALSDAGWSKDDKGKWQGQTAPETPAETPVPTGEAATSSAAEAPAGGAAAALMTEAALRQSVEAAITTEREYLAQLAGAGAVMGMGAGTQPSGLPTEQERIEHYKNMGLSEAEAKIAVAGRKVW